jgi:superfamily II DNA or RNA helicase
MADKGIQVKMVLLLQPQKLLHRAPVVQLLKVAKMGTTIEMEELPITSATVSLYFKSVDPATRALILKFSSGNIEREKTMIAFQSEKAGLKGAKAEMMQDKALARYFMKYLGQLKSNQAAISWYHRVTQPGSNRVATAPCVYHPLSVSLLFACENTPQGPALRVFVKHSGQTLPLDDYRRFYFLLLRNNEYRHLSAPAFEALEWLDEQELKGHTPESFLEKIAAPLQKMQQTVDTDGLLQKEVVEVVPERRLHMSELNNNFLMMTPQFLYDGILIDGPFESVAEKQFSGKPILVKRNKEAETGFSEWLRALHPNFARQYNGYFYLNFADAQKKHWFLKTYHQLLEHNIEITGMDLLKHFRYSPHKETTKLSIVEQNENYLLVEMDIAFGKEKVPLPEAQKMLLSGQKVVMLKDGSMGVLSDEWLQQYGTVIKHAKIKGKQIQVPKWIALGLEDEGEDAILKPAIDQSWLRKWKQWCKEETALYPLPPMVQVPELRRYQQRGYDWMNLLAEGGGSVCLADDMGLGKTLQAICFICNRLHHFPAGRHLIVSPASLVYNWQQEFEKFAPGVNTAIYHGASRNAAIFENGEIQVVLTSYGTMRQDIEILTGHFFDVIVLDESHHIKNPTTLISRAAITLQAQTRIALSGTPVMNGTQDLYAQMNFLLPGLLGSREFFRKEYAIPIEQQRDAEKAKKLQRLIAPFVLRRTKEQVAKELPDKVESVLWCEMGQDQRAAYENIKEQIRSSVLLEIEHHGLQKGKMSILAGLTKLRQLCNSAELVAGEDLFCYDSIKTEVLIEELTQIIPLHRALIFSQFTSMLDLLERDLQKAGISYQRLDGSTAIKERQELVNRFQDESAEVKVFLLSLKAGNAGLTLTAADYVFLFDPWWNVAVENQAIDRTHRIGQRRQVFAYRMICKGTIEEKIMRMQQQKKKIAEDLVSTDDGFMQTLTLEDVKYLLE